MRNSNHIFLFYIFFLSWQYDAFSQPIAGSGLQQRIAIVTDRALYAAGESVYFSAFETSLSRFFKRDWSKVLYLDIIRPEGQIMASGKFPFNDFTAYGSIKIPDDLVTGTYYMRVYTKWMRNYLAEDLTYVSIQVINPFLTEHLPVDSLENMEGSKKVLVAEDLTSIKIHNLKSVYSKREKINISIEAQQSIYDPVLFQVSIVPYGSERDQFLFYPETRRDATTEITYIPETRGVSISGKVFQSGLVSFEPYSHVFLTVLDSARNLYTGISDSLGGFYFHLPGHFGEKEIFISAKNEFHIPLEIMVDKDYSSKTPILPSPLFNPENFDSVMLIEVLRNQQINTIYYPDSKDTIKNNNQGFMRFYGSPDFSIQLDDFIDLPSLKEYFLELIPFVRIIKSKQGTRFRIPSPQVEMNIFDPLVLVDGVAIHNNDALLAISPQKVRGIEVIDKPWIMGDIIFGGIISILSKEGDFAGADLPATGIFLNYDFYLHTSGFPQFLISSENNLPDCRNTLYWEPGLIVNPGELKNIVFSTSDSMGEYVIVISSVSDDGSIRRHKERFIVR